MTGGPVHVLGAGAWGTALATVLVRAGHAPRLWARDAALVDAINRERSNAKRLPGVALDGAITATASLADLCDASALLYAGPAQALRTLLGDLTPHLTDGAALVICAKGIERGSGLLLSQVAAEAAPGLRVAILSGPSFAADVAHGLPTAITLAADDAALAEDLAVWIGVPTFRPYSSADPVGAQIGGAVKNVLAIACGIVEGRGLGASARAALISRGFAEMTRLGVAMGAQAETLAGLSGLGDLVLTCTSGQSRNMALGLALGRGDSLDTARARGAGIAEGVHTAQAVRHLAETHGVDMPIAGAVAAIVEGHLTIEAAIETLLRRPFRPEPD